MKDLFTTTEIREIIAEMKNSEINTHEEFINCVYEVLYEAIDNLESMANIYVQSNENQLTGVIFTYLKGSKKFQEVNFDSNNRGHCDLMIKEKRYRWIGESKIHSVDKYLYKGLRQLILRYMNGSVNENHPALLIFFRKPKVKSLMNNWRDFLTKISKIDSHQKRIQFLSSLELDKELKFISTHTHEITENEISINHIPILIHFKPEDTKK